LAEPEFAAYLAIDWADQKHVYALQAAASEKCEMGELENRPEAVDLWAAELGRRFQGRPIAVCLEQSRGALVYMLSKYAQFVLYPLHPAAVGRFRAAFYPSGAKDDPLDAALELEILVKHRKHLRRLEPDTVETRLLQFLTEERRNLVDERTAHSNRLRSKLKWYFPQVLHWFSELDSALVGDLLERWPTLEQLQHAQPETLRQFFHQHNCRKEELIEQRLEEIGKAIPATRDQAVIDSCVLVVQAECALLAALRPSIAKMEERIGKVVAGHPDLPIFDSLPGAGQVMVPRLIAAMGTRRERFASASDIQNCVGISPVKKSSGNAVVVQFRHACPKFVRQTFHEWAGHSIVSSAWARDYYERQIAKGKKHHAAVRSLAYKWIRVLYACWRDRVPYDEERYCKQLAARRPSQVSAQKATPQAPAQPATPPVDFLWESLAGFFKFSRTTS
jgi:transposase